MTRKRIVLFTSSLRAGGAERVVATLSRQLANKYDVRILLFTKDISYELDPEANVDVLGSGSSPDGLPGILMVPSLARRLLSYCESCKPDAVISFLSRPNFVVSLAKKRGLRAKVLISERAYTPLWYPDNDLRGYIGKRLTKALYPYADAILPNSEGTRVALEEIYGIRNRYFVVKNPIAIDTIMEKAKEVVDDMHFDGFTFVCVARFLDQKNHRLLIEAFSRVADDSRLLLIGKGPLLQKARTQVNKLGIAGKVTFIEGTSNPFKYLSRSQCFVLSSNFEGFPNVLLEALACGLPIISTDCLTGPRELLAPGGTSIQSAMEIGKFGVLVPVQDPKALANAMELMLKDGRLREQLALAAPKRAADFKESSVIHDFCRIIEAVLAQGSVIENSPEMNETRKRV